MGDTSKISPDGGQTIYDIKDRKAVRWTEAKGYVGKNLIFATGKSQTKGGVTFTVDSDGIITANGTATSEIYFDVYEDNYTNFFKRCGGTRVKAILSGCADNGSGSTYYISFAIYNPNRVQASEYGNGNIISFTIPEDENTTCKLYINIKSGVTVSNLKFKPMIRLASVSDDTYEPYLTPNTDLANISALVDYTENSNTASRAYSIGDHFYRNSKFCTVVANIASGATLTENTNFVTMPVATWLTRQLLDVNYNPELAAGDDLNNIDWGVRKCSGGTSSSVSHKPDNFSGAFAIYSIRIFGTDYKRQILFARDSADIYTRICAGNTWQSWKKITLA